jgi:hypothetical protein
MISISATQVPSQSNKICRSISIREINGTTIVRLDDCYSMVYVYKAFDLT